MLFSISSINILSSVLAISVTSKRRPHRPRSPRPSPPLHLRTAATKQLPAQGQKTVSFSTQQAGSNGLLRAAGSGKAAAARSSSSGGGEGEKQIEFEALKAPAC